MKKLHRICAVAAALAICAAGAYLLGACASQNAAREGYDEFTGQTVRALDNLQIGDGSLSGLRLDIAEVSAEGGGAAYQIRAMYRGLSWLEAHQLQWIIDGERIQTDGRREASVINANVVEELFYVRVDRAFLVKLARAQEVRVRLAGSKDNADGSLKAEHFEALREYTGALSGGSRSAPSMDADDAEDDEDEDDR